MAEESQELSVVPKKKPKSLHPGSRKFVVSLPAIPSKFLRRAKRKSPASLNSTQDSGIASTSSEHSSAFSADRGGIQDPHGAIQIEEILLNESGTGEILQPRTSTPVDEINDSAVSFQEEHILEESLIDKPNESIDFVISDALNCLNQEYDRIDGIAVNQVIDRPSSTSITLNAELSINASLNEEMAVTGSVVLAEISTASTSQNQSLLSIDSGLDFEAQASPAASIGPEFSDLLAAAVEIIDQSEAKKSEANLSKKSVKQKPGPKSRTPCWKRVVVEEKSDFSDQEENSEKEEEKQEDDEEDPEFVLSEQEEEDEDESNEGSTAGDGQEENDDERESSDDSDFDQALENYKKRAWCSVPIKKPGKKKAVSFFSARQFSLFK